MIRVQGWRKPENRWLGRGGLILNKSLAPSRGLAVHLHLVLKDGQKLSLNGIERQLQDFVSRRHKARIVELFLEIDSVLPKYDYVSLPPQFRVSTHGENLIGVF